jgi:hypothetical protein
LEINFTTNQQQVWLIVQHTARFRLSVFGDPDGVNADQDASAEADKQ